MRLVAEKQTAAGFEAQRARVLLRWHDAAAARRWLEIKPIENNDLMLEFAIAQLPAHALIVVGDYPQAFEQPKSAPEGYRSRNMQSAITQTLALKVLAYWLMGDLTAACNTLDEVLDRTVHTGEVLPLALKAPPTEPSFPDTRESRTVIRA